MRLRNIRIAKYYPRSGSYDFRYKSIAVGATDVVKVDFGGYLEKDSVVFKDRFGVPIKLNPQTNTLTFTAPQNADTNYIYAYDKTGERIGKLMVKTYAVKEYNVKLVRLYDSNKKNVKAELSFTESELQNYLNKVYAQANVQFKVSSMDFGVSDLLPFSHGDKKRFSGYNEDQKRILEAFDGEIKDDINYLFFLPDGADNNGVDGYNPFGYNFGFIYHGAGLRTMAHELGHGIGSLRHPFSDEVAVKGQTDNLMDYNGGEGLFHFQWDNMQKPPKRIFKWRFEEEDAEALEKHVEMKWLAVDNKGAFYFAPSGKPLYLNDLDSVAVVQKSFSGIPKDTLLTSAIYGFVMNNTQYFADILEIKNGGVVTLYFNGYVKTGTYVGNTFVPYSMSAPKIYYIDGTQKTRKYANEIYYSKNQVPGLKLFNSETSKWDTIYPLNHKWIPYESEYYKAEGQLTQKIDYNQYFRPQAKPSNVDFRYLDDHQILVFNRKTREISVVFDIPEDKYIDFGGKKIHISNLNHYNIDTVSFSGLCDKGYGWMAKDKVFETYAVIQPSYGNVWHIDYSISLSGGILWLANGEVGMTLGVGFDDENVAFYGNLKSVVGFGNSRFSFETLLDNYLIDGDIKSDNTDFPSLSMGVEADKGFSVTWDWGYKSARDLFGYSWAFQIPATPLSFEFDSHYKPIGVGMSLSPEFQEMSKVTNVKFSHDFNRGVLCHKTEADLVMKMILNADDNTFKKKPTTDLKAPVSFFWGVDENDHLFLVLDDVVIYSEIEASKSQDGTYFITDKAKSVYNR